MAFKILTIECAGDSADKLQEELRALSGEDVLRAQKRNLDGSLESILLVVQIAATAVAAIIPLLTPYLAGRNVRRVKFSDGTREIEIENPTAVQFKQIWADYQAAGVRKTAGVKKIAGVKKTSGGKKDGGR